jgi:phosphoglycerol transferase MdoB-like AlkP superfamily enzyme
MARKKPARSSKKRGSKSGKWFAGNILLVMSARLLVVLLLLFLSRILFYLFNLGYFSNLSIFDALKLFLIGLRFDISALLILNIPYILMNSVPFHFRENKWYQGIANGWYFVFNIIGLMGNFIDTIYFRFTLKRTTADIFSYLGVGGDFNKLIPQFLADFWYILITFILFLALLIYLFNRFSVAASGKQKGGPVAWYLLNTILFAITGAITVIGIRGGLQLRPISLVSAGQHTTAKNIPLLLNTPFAIAKTYNHETVRTQSFFAREKELAAIYTPVHHWEGSVMKKLNVVIIIMESFSREHIGSLNRSLDDGRYQGFTPFMDSLIRQGLYFDAFANGKTSIQGIPAVLSGIPSLMNESFIQSGYSADRYTSIAGLLKSEGYQTAFFHGGTNGTMGFDSYTKLVGFDHYFGRSEYNNEKDYDGKWGIRDEEFFRFTARKIGELQQPFVAALFSLSSHHPYFVPGKYANIFRKGHLPIQQSIMYADRSLAEFFHAVKHTAWYEHTLFVITADHTSEGYDPYYKTAVGQVSIPLLFYKPGSDLRGYPKIVAQQTDVMPTVLNYLGFNKNYLAFGTDLVDSASVHFSIHYLSGIYGLIKDGYYLEFDGSSATSLFNLSQDPLQTRNIINKEKKEKERLELFVKAFIQQYNNRVIENRLVVE